MQLRAILPHKRIRWAILTVLFVVSQFGPLTLLSGSASASGDWGKIEVKKQLNPTNDSGRFNLKIDGNTERSNASNGDSTGKENVREGTHTVSETAYSSATKLTDYITTLVCKKGNGNGPTVALSNLNVTDANTRGATIQVNEDDDIVCIFTNTRKATLIVTKTITADNGATNVTPSQFSYQINGGAAIPFNANGSNSQLVDPSGTYTVTEVPVAGFAPAYGSNCTNVTFTPGQTKTCTITNDDQPGTLIVKKVVIADNGSDATAANFSYQINGGAAVAFNANGENSQTVNAGTYTVTEPEAEGFTTTYDGCDQVYVGNGQTKTCTITNDDIPPSLTLIKELSGKYNGAAKTTDWKLYASGPSYVKGKGGAQSDATFKAGTYNLGEKSKTYGSWQYDSEWSCMVGDAELKTTVLQLGLGETATCTVTNSLKPGTIVVKKYVDNSDGGTKTAGDFSVTVNDTSYSFIEDDEDELYGEVQIPVTQGSYTITEDQANQDGYLTYYSSCYEPEYDKVALLEGGEVPAVNEGCESNSCENLYVAAGDYVVCEIYNDDVAVDLSVVKSDNDAVTEAGASFEYTLAVTNNSESYGATNVSMTDVIPANLKVTAIASGDWACEVTGQDANGYGGTLTCKLESLAAGESATVVTVTVLVATGATGSITNTAIVASAERELNSEDNSSTEITPVKSINAILTTQCRSGFPYLVYDVTLSNFTANKVTFTWYSANPGDDPTVPQATQVVSSPGGAQVTSFSGAILYPGASVNPADWPGYELVNGVWVQTRDDVGGKLRPNATVTVSVNPTQVAAVTYPPPTSTCDTNPPATLTNTGAGDSMAMGILVAITMLLGLGYVAQSRKQNKS